MHFVDDRAAARAARRQGEVQQPARNADRMTRTTPTRVLVAASPPPHKRRRDDAIVRPAAARDAPSTRALRHGPGAVPSRARVRGHSRPPVAHSPPVRAALLIGRIEAAWRDRLAGLCPIGRRDRSRTTMLTRGAGHRTTSASRSAGSTPSTTFRTRCWQSVSPFAEDSLLHRRIAGRRYASGAPRGDARRRRAHGRGHAPRSPAHRARRAHVAARRRRDSPCRSSTSIGSRSATKACGDLVRDLRGNGSDQRPVGPARAPAFALCGRSRRRAFTRRRDDGRVTETVRNPPFRGLDAFVAALMDEGRLTSAPHELLTRHE